MLIEEEKQLAVKCILSGEKNGGFRFDEIFRFYSSDFQVKYLSPAVYI